MGGNWQSKIPAKRRGYWLEGAGKFRQALTLHRGGAMQGVVSTGSGVGESGTWGGMEFAPWQRCAHALTQLGAGGASWALRSLHSGDVLQEQRKRWRNRMHGRRAWFIQRLLSAYCMQSITMVVVMTIPKTQTAPRLMVHTVQ